MNIRPVTVEFLRAGPRHNQLLSPLTQYLAVCGDSPAGVVNLPYEHAVFERRREELRYAISSDSDSRLRGILDQTGREMADILSLVPGLPGVISARVDPSEILNLRLVLSASELATLPFELSKIPAGGGAPPDNWLLLHANSPVCLTRHNRAVRSDNVVWPTRPRILYAYGDDVPAQEHLDALVEALKPWTGDGGKVDDWLTVVPNATLPLLNAETKRAAYTHVHILAHGAKCGEAPDAPFGVQLTDSVVNGRALAAALFDVSLKGIHRPTVVTLATCDSGGEGSVINAPDASVAHDLHESGIPLVIASQFPLSTSGSTEFVKLFYQEQLAGTHPLLSVYRSRLMLHAFNSSRFHDWASLVVYEALPPDLQEQLYEVQYAQKRAVLDRTLETMENARDNEHWTAEEHEVFTKQVDLARCDLPAEGPYAAECVGLRAASWKRQAEVDFGLATRAPAGEHRDLHAESCYLNLQRAQQAYLAAANSFLVNVNQAVHRKATLHWLLGQALSLEIVLGKPLNEEYWTVAKYSAMAELQHPQAPGSAWGHGTLAELMLLRLVDPKLDDAGVAELSDEVVEHATELVAHNGLVSEPVSSTSRQFQRYLDWWGQDGFADLMAPFRVPHKKTWRRERGLTDTVNKVLEIFGADREREKRKAKAAKLAKAATEPPAQKPPQAPPIPPAVSTTPPPPTAAPEVLAARRPAPAGGVFRIEMLPANNGDCLWIEYGDAKRPNRVLIDCGAESAAKLLQCRVTELEKAGQLDPVELFMLTHIDSDHIGGVLPFFRNRGNLQFQEVWFNAEPQLPPAVLGVMQGEKFAEILTCDDKLSAAWNKSAGQVKGKPSAIVRTDEGPLPSYILPGGLRLTVLSPGLAQLNDLARVWRTELKKFREQKGHEVLSAKAKPQPPADLKKFDVEALAKSKEKPDPSVANGSSIAVLAEFDGRAALLTGDAHAEVVADSIRRVLKARARAGGDRLKIDAMKLSHHGSTNALTKELLGVIDCNRYLISSDGSKFYHPDREAVSRVIFYGGQSPRLFFNYRSEMNGFWGEEFLRDKYGYRTEYPEDGKAGKAVEL